MFFPEASHGSPLNLDEPVTIYKGGVNMAPPFSFSVTLLRAMEQKNIRAVAKNKRKTKRARERWGVICAVYRTLCPDTIRRLLGGLGMTGVTGAVYALLAS